MGSLHLRTLLSVLLLALGVRGLAQEPNDMIELLRSDLRNERVSIIQASLALSEQELVVFRPVFEAFTAELKVQWMERLKLVDDYTKAREEGMDAKQASTFMDRMFSMEKADLELRQRYAQRMEKVLSADKVARWMQLERRLGQLMELQVANEVIQVPGRR